MMFIHSNHYLPVNPPRSLEPFSPLKVSSAFPVKTAFGLCLKCNYAINIWPTRGLRNGVFVYAFNDGRVCVHKYRWCIWIQQYTSINVDWVILLLYTAWLYNWFKKLRYGATSCHNHTNRIYQWFESGIDLNTNEQKVTTYLETWWNGFMAYQTNL
jgi:hypothetical protein